MGEDGEGGRNENSGSNYFVEKPEVAIAPIASEQKCSMQAFANFETAPNVLQHNGRARHIRVPKEQATDNAASNEQNRVDMSVIIESCPAGDVGVLTPSEGGSDAKTEDNTVVAGEMWSDNETGFAAPDMTETLIHNETLLFRVGKSTSEKRPRRDSTSKAHHRHLVDTPERIQQYLRENKVEDDEFQSAAMAETEWLPPSQQRSNETLEARERDDDRLLDTIKTKENKNLRKDSARPRIPFDSVCSAIQSRRPLRELERTTLVPGESSAASTKRPATAAASLPSLNTDDTTRSENNPCDPNGVNNPYGNADAGTNNANETIQGSNGVTHNPTLEAKSTFVTQRESESEHADEAPFTAQQTSLVDGDHVPYKSTLPPLSSDYDNSTDTPPHMRRRDRESEQHLRSDDEISNNSRHRKHRHRHHRHDKHRHKGDSAKIERRSQEKDETNTSQTEKTPKLGRIQNTENNKEIRKFDEKRNITNNGQDTKSQTSAASNAANNTEFSIKDFVISYKKSHREKTTKHSVDML